MAASDSTSELGVALAPSATKLTVTDTAKEIEREEIAELLDWYALSADVARQAGFDGIELHFAHGFLPDQFLSPIFNRRTDEYGGSRQNRMRFALEALAAVRECVGNEIAIGARVGATDFMGGIGVDQAKAFLGALEQTGQLDYVSLTAAGMLPQMQIAPSDIPAGWLLEAAAEARGATSLPTIVVGGGLGDPAQAEALVADGKADLIGMTRAQIADPEFANKVRDGREDEIVHCIRANQGCAGRAFSGKAMQCTVNPAAGREGRFDAEAVERAAAPGRWVVVGGGPAGAKAAGILAKRGHAVTLLERDDRLGGQLNLALLTPGRDLFARLSSDLEAEMARRGVEVRIGTEAAPDLIAGLEPDGVLVATGAVADRTGASIAAPHVAELPGAKGENVLAYDEVLLESRPVGKRVALLDGDGTRLAAGTAEVLLDRGHEVELITRFNSLTPGIPMTLDQTTVYRRLFGKGLSCRLNAWAKVIGRETVVVYDIFTQEEEVRRIDSVVLASGRVAQDSLYHSLRAAGIPTHRIGDCVAPRTLDHAIWEGFLAGRELFSTVERWGLAGEVGPLRNSRLTPSEPRR